MNNPKIKLRKRINLQHIKQYKILRNKLKKEATQELHTEYHKILLKVKIHKKSVNRNITHGHSLKDIILRFNTAQIDLQK